MTHTVLPADTKTASRLPGLLALSLRVHWPFFAIGLAYVALSQWLMADIETTRAASLQGLVFGFLKLSLPAGLVAVFLFRLLQYPLALKPDSPTKQMGRDLLDLIRHPRWIVTGVPLLAAMLLFNKGMLELKPMIPVIKPFAWDETFMQLDRTLHFGFDPWVLLQPVLGYDWVTFMICNLYNFWFLALFGTFHVVWFCAVAPMWCARVSSSPIC